MMQAFITEDGTLCIIPTTPTERYALKQWRKSDGALDTGSKFHVDDFDTIANRRNSCLWRWPASPPLSSPKKGTN
jgi:hypothetical protein